MTQLLVMSLHENQALTCHPNLSLYLKLLTLITLPVPLLVRAIFQLVRTVVDTCCKNKIPLHSTQLCYVGEAVMACSIDGNPEIVNELLATVSIVVNSANELSE